MGVFGFEFTIIAPGNIESVGEAKALIAHFLLPNTKIAIYSIDYDYLSVNNQSQQKPLEAEIKGKVWMER